MPETIQPVHTCGVNIPYLAVYVAFLLRIFHPGKARKKREIHIEGSNCLEDSSGLTLFLSNLESRIVGLPIIRSYA